MSTLVTKPCVYLAVTDEDITQVLNWFDAMKECALENVSKEVSKVGHPATTTFRFPLPSCMAVEVEHTKGELV